MELLGFAIDVAAGSELHLTDLVVFSPLHNIINGEEVPVDVMDRLFRFGDVQF